MADKEFVRSILLQSGLHVPIERIIEELERRGIIVSKKFVIHVKGQILHNEQRKAIEQAKRPPAIRCRNRPQQRKIPKRN